MTARTTNVRMPSGMTDEESNFSSSNDSASNFR
jgi:hypothetical protein